MLLATSLSSNLTPFRCRAGSSLFVPRSFCCCLCVIVLHYIVLHRSRFFPASIHALLCFSAMSQHCLRLVCHEARLVAGLWNLKPKKGCIQEGELEPTLLEPNHLRQLGCGK